MMPPRPATARDFALMAALQLVSALGFGIAAAGAWLTANHAVTVLSGGYAVLCLVQAIRNGRVWRGERWKMEDNGNAKTRSSRSFETIK